MKLTRFLFLKGVLMSGDSRSLTRSGLIVMFLNGAAIVAAFVREATIAYYYGASAELDAFSVAFSFVRTVTELLPLTLGLAIIPLLARRKEGESAERKAGLFGTWTFIVLTAIALVYLLIGPLVVRVIAPGFDEKRMRMAEFFIWIVSPIIIVRGMFIPVKSFANFFERFALPEMGRVVVGATIPILLLLFAHHWGQSALPRAYLVATAAGVIVATAALRGLKVRLVVTGVVRVIKDAVPVLVPLIVFFVLSYAQNAVALVFLSSLEKGTISSMRYAVNVTSVPVSVIGGAIATVIFPRLAVSAADGQTQSVKEVATRALLFGVFTGAVTATVLSLLDMPVVRILFQRGRFSPRATQICAGFMSIHAISIPYSVALGVLSRLSVSVGRPFWLAVATAAYLPVQVAVAWPLLAVFGGNAVALAHVVATAFSVTVLVRLCQRWLSTSTGKTLFLFVATTAPAAASCVAIRLFQQSLPLWERFFLAFAAASTYILACYLLSPALWKDLSRVIRMLHPMRLFGRQR